jgi:hypothetical protein
VTSPVDQRAAAIEAVKEAHKILSEHHLMSRRRMAQLERVALGLSDLDRGVISPLMRPASRTGTGRPGRNSEEVLLTAAARALHVMFAKESKFLTAHQDVAVTLSVRGYTLGDGSPITAETVRGWMIGVKDPRVLRLTKELLATATGSPKERARTILRFIAQRLTALPPKPKKGSKKRAN